MSVLVELPPELYDREAFKKFEPRSEFSLDHARAMMWMSQLAYETHRPATIEHVRKLWEFDEITPVVRTNSSVIKGAIMDSRGIIAKRGNVTVVAFAGTDPAVLENVISDFDVAPVGPTGTHHGFKAAFDAVAEDVGPAITASAKPVFITGHSLGAALATFTTQRHANAAQLAATYLYGAPRVGGTTFASQYNAARGERTYRLVHGHDVVATVPMSRFGFHHVGRLLACASNAKFDRTRSLAPAADDDPQFAACPLNAFAQDWPGRR